MSFSTIVARVDTDDKRNFNAFCASVGLNSSISINSSLKLKLSCAKTVFLSINICNV